MTVRPPAMSASSTCLAFRGGDPQVESHKRPVVDKTGDRELEPNSLFIATKCMTLAREVSQPDLHNNHIYFRVV